MHAKLDSYPAWDFLCPISCVFVQINEECAWSQREVVFEESRLLGAMDLRQSERCWGHEGRWREMNPFIFGLDNKVFCWLADLIEI